MEDLIEMAKTQYNITVTNIYSGYYIINSKYFSSVFKEDGYESLSDRIQIMYLKDNFYEMIKEKSIYDVEFSNEIMCLRDICIIICPDNTVAIGKEHNTLKRYCLKTQFYDILNDFPEYFRSGDIKIALK
jgi:hypothetical protein